MNIIHINLNNKYHNFNIYIKIKYSGQSLNKFNEILFISFYLINYQIIFEILPFQQH